MKLTPTVSLAAWIADTSQPGSIDPEAPLDDLEPLRHIVGDARVVALGESAHYIPEFHLVRHRLLRFLLERMGFSTYALEAPYSTGRSIDAWIAGGAGDIDAIADDVLPIRLGRVPELHRTLTWLRESTANAGQPVRFLGTDVPGSGGSIVPALELVREAISVVDAEAASLTDRALELARSYHAPETFALLGRYAKVPAAEQDELSALLSRVLARLETTGLTLDAAGVDVGQVRLDLRGAWYADHLHRDVAGRGLSTAAASRDAFMAEVVLKRLERLPDDRIVVASHNIHIQRTPSADAAIGQVPQGFHLDAALGDDYRPIAITAPGGHTAQIKPDPAVADGFEIVDVELDVPVPDSFDAALVGPAPLTIVDLRAAPRGVDVRRMRMEGYYVELPVLDAFDAVAWVPQTTVSPAVSPTP